MTPTPLSMSIDSDPYFKSVFVFYLWPLSIVLSSTNIVQSGMQSFPPFLALYFLPGGPSWERTTAGERWVLLFEVERLWKGAWLGLSDRARLPGRHQIDRSPSSCRDVSSSFLLTPSRSGPLNPPIHNKLELFFKLIIKTRQPATEVSCLGYRRAAGVKGHVGFESPFVGKDRPKMNRGTDSM